jgi:hypothetical protein
MAELVALPLMEDGARKKLVANVHCQTAGVNYVRNLAITPHLHAEEPIAKEAVLSM